LLPQSIESREVLEEAEKEIDREDERMGRCRRGEACRHRRIGATRSGSDLMLVGVPESMLVGAARSGAALLTSFIPPTYMPSPLACTLNMLVVVNNRYLT
jgi:hypothetical protein